MKAPIEVSPLAWLEAVESQRRQAGLRRSLRPRPAVATELDLASNDYLGLSQHPGNTQTYCGTTDSRANDDTTYALRR